MFIVRCVVKCGVRVLVYNCHSCNYREKPIYRLQNNVETSWEFFELLGLI